MEYLSMSCMCSWMLKKYVLNEFRSFHILLGLPTHIRQCESSTVGELIQAMIFIPEPLNMADVAPD